MSQLLPIADDKLEEYMVVWEKLLYQGKMPTGEITLYEDYINYGLYRRYLLRFGEDMRELTQEQSRRVYNWMHSLGERKPV